ncbi:MAG: TIGR03557 family F420-dependent LLM class oxidoreductase [Thermoproteales archaeon]|nr:TIGR03557 family F420-dependent LLM class oxidoreductase [Thermoproteales archaeon]
MKLEFEIVTTIERYPPEKMIDWAIYAEKKGFDGLGVPDHFHPWSHKYGQGTFSWVWIAITAEKTKRIKLGSCVTAPTIRYHPAIYAQAFATLGYMYPGRIYAGLGTGEPLNEMPLGLNWPSGKERIERLEEAIIIIKKLWYESRITFKGKYWNLIKANLYTKPKEKIPIYVAGTGVMSARVAGRHGDGFITVPHVAYNFDKVMRSLRKGLKESDRKIEDFKLIMHMMISYDEDFDKALKATRCWAATVLPALYKYGIFDPVEIDEYGELIGDEVLAKKFLIVTSEEEIIKKLEEFIKKGFTRFQFNNSSPDYTSFLDIMGDKVIPYLKEEYKEK